MPSDRRRVEGHGKPPPKPDAPPMEVVREDQMSARPAVLPEGQTIRQLKQPDITIPCPGSPCQIGGEGERIDATISAVSIHPGNRILVQVAWWSGRTHHEEWLERHEVNTPATESRMLVGFASQKK